MAKIDRDELLSRTDLRALLDELSAMPPGNHKPSARWACIDADHADTHPSVTVFAGADGTERWRCHSGGHGGTAIDAVMRHFRLPAGDAAEMLARRAGMLGVAPLAPVRPKAVPAAPAPTALDPDAVRYVEACERLLWTPAGEPVRDWLHQRGFTDDTLRLNRVGADPGPKRLWRAKGLPWHGVGAVFPALDHAGEISYLQTRYLNPGERSKYDNPPAAMGTNPRVAWLRPKNDRHPGVLVVSEGIPDGLALSELGYASAAVLGATYPDERVADSITTGRADRQVIIAFDGDRAGVEGAQHLAALLDARGVPAVQVKLPTGRDLNSMLVDDPQWIANALDKAPGPVRWAAPAPVDAFTLWANEAIAHGEIVASPAARPDAYTTAFEAGLQGLTDPARQRLAAEHLVISGTRAVLANHRLDFTAKTSSATVLGFWEAHGDRAAGQTVRDVLDPMTWRHVHSQTRTAAPLIAGVRHLAGVAQSMAGLATAREPHSRPLSKATDDQVPALRLVR